jgi:DtxR family Mn-dependent transcriptional regulator
MEEALTARAEDYMRAVYEVIGRKGFARIKDVARELDVKPSTAVEMIRKLNGGSLLVYEKYSGITLTQRGREIAEAVKTRRDTFRKFLDIILVPIDMATKDAHVLEHQLDPKTILQFTRFVEFVTSAPEHPKFVGRWMEQFKKFCDERNHSGVNGC